MTPNTGNAKVVEWEGERVLIHGPDGEIWLRIVFQDKPVLDVGNNGICMLDILDAMIFRLAQFEKKWPRLENRQAMTYMEFAKAWLKTKRDARKREAEVEREGA